MTEELRELLSHVDHTLLGVTATWEEIRQITEDGIRYGTASVCIPANYVKQASEYAKGGVKICTVIGFPNGYDTTAAKVFMAKDAIADGADEVDMVIPIGWLKDGRTEEITAEIAAVKEACGDHILKVIIETCLLTDEEKVRACSLSESAGAAFVKTSTGFSTGGANVHDVALMKKTVDGRLQVKASGGIHTPEQAQELIAAGADRIGASNGVALLG